MVLNSSFIAAEEGISETIMNGLYLNLERTLNIENKDGEEIPIGRICTPKEYPTQKTPLNLESIIKRVKTVFEAEKMSYVGDLSKIIKKCCVIGGNNSDIKLMERALVKIYYLTKMAILTWTMYPLGNIRLRMKLPLLMEVH